MELKNQLTGQNYKHSENQYRFNRDPKESLLQFKRVLVHFCVDNNQVSMTTNLKGGKTRFFPYNKDIENPPVENDYRSSYLWKEVLNPKSLLDIIENYEGTTAAKLATYSAGMSYLNIRDYQNAITYLDQFNSEDVLLGALAKGAIGDAFAQMDQPEKALDYYIAASNINNNTYSTPKFLYKAAIIGSKLGKNKQALAYLERIKKEFKESREAKMVSVQIAKIKSIID